MTETKWTPGPWAMPDVEIGIISKFISPGRWDGMIATADCGNYARSRSEGLANANLIAAAPDLYAALDFVKFIEEKGYDEKNAFVDLEDDDECICLTFRQFREIMLARRKARGE